MHPLPQLCSVLTEQARFSICQSLVKKGVFLLLEDDRVLAIDPMNLGFGFAVLEGATRLIDWGIRDTGHADNARSLRLAEVLLDHYVPDALIVEDTDDNSSRQSARVRTLIKAISEIARTRGVAVHMVSRREVLEVFGHVGAPTKELSAAVIIEHFEEFAPRKPPHRKPMSEDVSGSIFDATAMALVTGILREPLGQ